MRIVKIILVATLLAVLAGPATAETISYSYDVAGRLTHAYYPDGSIEYVYDANGNLLERIVSAGTSPSPIAPTMTAARVAGVLAITYSTDACVSPDHALFIGTLGDFASIGSGDCSVGSDGSLTVPLPGGSVWFLVAGIAGDEYSSVGSGASGERTLTGIDTVCPELTPDTTRTCP